MPFWFLPKEVGLKGAVYADAGSLWDYQGPTSWAQTSEVNAPAVCQHVKPSPGTCAGFQFDDTNVIRTSVGVGLIWASPFGPLRFDYAVPITQGPSTTGCRNSGSAAEQRSELTQRPDRDGWNGAAGIL